MEIIYNVTCNLPVELETQWLAWIKEHIPHMLGTGLFIDARLTRVLVQEDDGTSTFSVQYKAHDRKALDLYYVKYADAMQQIGLKKFGDEVFTFRTELELIDEYRVSVG
ncbi:MAG: DUF4286 family protein [Nonlabens sp.]